MQKSSVRTLNYRPTSSQTAERLRNFREQMADYARGERLRELREHRHESQEAVAAELGVSTKSLRAWEHGGKIRWENAKRLGSFYGAEPESLVSRELPELVSTDDEPEESQLDRIENLLSSLIERLVAAGVLQAVDADTGKAPSKVPPTRRRPAA